VQPRAVLPRQRGLGEVEWTSIGNPLEMEEIHWKSIENGGKSYF